MSAVLLAGAGIVVFDLVQQQPARADYTDGAFAASKISMEAALRIWRKAAWQDDDFLSEIKLGDVYGDEHGDNKFFDPIESYVWYYLALKSDRAFANIDDGHARRIVSNYRHRARDRQQRLMLLMTADDRQQARDRIVYILSCRGADGFVKLGRIHTSDAGRNDGPYSGEPDFTNDSPDTYSGLSDMSRSSDSFDSRENRGYEYGNAAAQRRMLGIPSSSVIVPNDGEALMYFHIADNMGQPLAREYLRSIDRRVRRAGGLGARVAFDATNRARYWTPPFEFYPAGNTTSGVPYTDECYQNMDRQRALILAATLVPVRAVQEALNFLGWMNVPQARWGAAYGANEQRAISNWQKSVGDAPTGRLTAAESVRLIQTAAQRGNASSQNTLGVMYAKGIGVGRNFVRAEYWFKKAADQRYAAALYHLGVLYKVGPDGIKQDLSKGNDYFTASALAGFRPTMNQLGSLLGNAEEAPPRPGQH